MTQVGVILFCLSSCLWLSFGQATSTLTGTVLDSREDAVPGTAITVRNIGTGNERSVSRVVRRVTTPFHFSPPGIIPSSWLRRVSAK
jgi:hypothetical protein